MLFEREWSWASKPMPQPWHSILLGVSAIVLFAVCVYGYQSTRDFLRSAQRSTGVVVNVAGDADGATFPHVRFVDSTGRTHEFDSNLHSSPPKYSVGAQVPVLYPPGAPEKAQIEGFMELWMVSLVTGIVGLAMSVAAILTWIFRDVLFKQSRRV